MSFLCFGWWQRCFFQPNSSAADSVGDGCSPPFSASVRFLTC